LRAKIARRKAKRFVNDGGADVRSESEKVDIGGALERVGGILRSRIRGERHQAIPQAGGREQRFAAGGFARDFDGAMRGGSAFERDCGALVCAEWAGGIVAREVRERGCEFFGRKIERLPPVAVKMIDDGAGVEDLANSRGIFAGDAENHVEEFVRAEGLALNGADVEIVGVFFGEADGNRFGERHRLVASG